ncbi:MAG TPA: S41 family peptidase [Steroidobacteraceae bacterium]|nr:S41 family peptidase [Steroidobacteraceae bacterium]
MRIRRLFLAIALVPLIAHAQSFSRADWIADFEQLKSLLTTNYPNLEWHARRGVDLPGNVSRARAALDRAVDDAEARGILERFIARLGDAHLSIEWDANSPDPADDASLPDCVRFGFRDDADTRAVAARLEGYQDISPKGATISAGFVTVGDRVLGVLRVPSFVPSLAQCEQFLRERTPAPAPAPATSALATYEDAIGTGVSRLWLAEVEERLRQLGARRPAALLVDVAGNGGGKQLAITLARMLGGEAVRAPALALVREPVRAQEIETRAQQLATLARKAPRAEREYLATLAPALQSAASAARQSCDLSPLWRGVRVSCTNLVSGPFFAGGLVERELPEAWLGRPWAGEISATAEYGAHARAWSGRVILLVDDGSASATELLAAMLQDAHAALVVGAPTMGAGCGWTMGQYTSSRILDRSHARVMIPDCARLRADGSNELDGIQPDVLIGFRRTDTPAQRAARLAKVLGTLPIF